MCGGEIKCAARTCKASRENAGQYVENTAAAESDCLFTSFLILYSCVITTPHNYNFNFMLPLPNSSNKHFSALSVRTIHKLSLHWRTIYYIFSASNTSQFWTVVFMIFMITAIYFFNYGNPTNPTNPGSSFIVNVLKFVNNRARKNICNEPPVLHHIL